MDNKTFKIEFIDSLPKDNVSRRLGDQLLRSGTSIIANFIEGQAGSSKKDFINFMQYSLKSANESKLWLSLLKDTKKGKSEKVVPLLKELSEITNIFGSIVVSSKKK